ncbi:hypothetical protein Emed_006360 [Eimeria media]
MAATALPAPQSNSPVFQGLTILIKWGKFLQTVSLARLDITAKVTLAHRRRVLVKQALFALEAQATQNRSALPRVTIPRQGQLLQRVVRLGPIILMKARRNAGAATLGS